MEPLRKLRQDCTVPTLLNKTNNSKRLLSPDQLQQHLFAKTEMECKSELRSVASTLNGKYIESYVRTKFLIFIWFCNLGLAALHIIKGDFKAAVDNYNSVLRWASDYSGTIW